MITRRELLAAGAASMQAAAQSPAKRPNVVIILADDLGWGDVGYHNSEIQTPNIDRFSTEGVRLNQCHFYPLCSPSRSGLLTGRSPMRYGMIYCVVRPWCPYGLPPDEHLMPESFRKLGYQTAICGKWHLGHFNRRLLPNARGFDHFYGHLNGAIDYFTHERDGSVDWQRNGVTVREEGYSTDLVASEAIRWMAARDRNRPFFLYLPFNAPHTPLQAPPELLAKYGSIQDKNRRTYAAMVDRLDTSVGRVLQAIAKEGIEKDTIVVFVSDNGGPVNAGARNGSLRAGKATVFQGGLRVPAIVRWPGRLAANTQSEQVMTVLDLFPTLLGAAGETPSVPKPLDGKNLWPLLAGGKTEAREDLFFAVGESEKQLAVRRHDWKLVRRVNRENGAVTDTLYRLDEDAEEKHELAAANGTLARELGKELDQFAALHPKCDILTSLTPHPGWITPKDWAAVPE